MTHVAREEDVMEDTLLAFDVDEWMERVGCTQEEGEACRKATIAKYLPQTHSVGCILGMI